MNRYSKTKPLAALVLSGMLLTGCSGMNETQQSTLSGGALGATLGAAGTAVTGGCVSCGAALGGAAGAAVGAMSADGERDN